MSQVYAPSDIDGRPVHRFLTMDWRSSGGRMHYADSAGAGTSRGPAGPVIMVHGNPTWSVMFEKLFALLAPEFRCLAPDHLGCGLSDKSGDLDYSFASRCRDFAAFVQHAVGNSPFHLLVHDWGGPVGLDYAVQNPDRILSLTACNTGAFPNPKANRLPWQIRACRLPYIGQLLVQSPLNAFCRGTLRTAVGRPLTAHRQRDYLRPYDSWQNRRAVKQFVDEIPLRPGDANMGRLTAIAEGLERLRRHPVLLFWGARDFVFDCIFLETWQSYLPQAQTMVLETAGHLVLEEAESYELAAIRDFLRQAEVARVTQPRLPPEGGHA